MYPHIFCFEHTLYIFIFTILLLLSIYFFIHLIKPIYYKYIIYFFAFINLSLTIWNRLSVCNYNLYTLAIIPNSFCSTTGILGALSILFLKKDSKILHFLLFAGGLSGFFVTLFPDYIAQNISFFYDKTFSSLLYHSGMFYLLVLSISLGYFKPTIKNWSALPLGICVYITWGYFANTNLGQANNMYLKTSPLKDVFMPWYLIYIILIFFYTILLFLIWKFDTTKKKL